MHTEYYQRQGNSSLSNYLTFTIIMATITMTYITERTDGNIRYLIDQAKHAHCNFTLTLLKELKQALLDIEHYEALAELKVIEDELDFFIPVVYPD